MKSRPIPAAASDAVRPPGATSQFRREDFDYVLPERLIAQQPSDIRGGSRLLAVGDQAIANLTFSDLPGLLRAGDLLVVNDTRVVNARLAATKDSGGQAEILLERIESERVALCQVRVSKPLQVGRTLQVADLTLEVLGREDQFYRLQFAEPVLDVLERHGSIPLPPYIERQAEADDETRYQTIWSRAPGAVAAPTAGLHFTEQLLEEIRAVGVQIAAVTLHVGAGTFQPVRSSELTDHRMHEESYTIDARTAAAISRTSQLGGRIVAVGTTVVRALESAASGDHQVRSGAGETALFITPGYRFKVVDALVTNFHLPESTLLMLVCAFAGYSQVMEAYAAAVNADYRFFSYGDAMFLQRQGDGAAPQGTGS